MSAVVTNQPGWNMFFFMKSFLLEQHEVLVDLGRLQFMVASFYLKSTEFYLVLLKINIILLKINIILLNPT